MKELEISQNLSLEIDFASLVDKETTISGQIQNIRVMGWGVFIILRTPLYTIQTVAENENLTFDPNTLKVESAVTLTGICKPSSIKDKAIRPNDYEIHIKNLEILSEPSEYPLPVDTTKKLLNVGFDTKLNLRSLTLRHPKERAVFKIQAAICNQFGNFLTDLGFTRICTPKLVSTGAEGGANIFKMDYFGKEAFLAQSPQFYKQMMVGVFGRVFEAAPVFRAEKFDTSRHLNEYTSLDFEMVLEDGYEQLIQIEFALLKSIFAALEKECAHEIALLGIEIPKLEKIVTVEFDDVHEIVNKKYKKDYRGEKDLAPEEESLICKYAKKNWDTDFVFVTHYPSEKRPFYTMDDPEREGRTLSFDLLYKGMEITTGGQRLYKYEDYITKMEKLGLDPENFSSYLQAFKFGMMPHGGLGLGLERLTEKICNFSNVKEACLFPRDINRLEP